MIALKAGHARWIRAALSMLLCLGLARPTAAADLLDVYRLALQHDPKFAAAHDSVLAARARVWEAGGALLPQIAVQGNDNRTRAATVFNDPLVGETAVDRGVRAWTWTLQLTQPLIHVASYLAYRESHAFLAEAEARYVQAREDLILRVARAYFDVLVAQKRIALADAQVRAMTEQEGQARRGFAAGTGAITDVDEAASKLALARARRLAALSILEDKRAALEAITGQPVPQQLSILKPSVVLPKPRPDVAQTWIDQAGRENAAVQAGRAALTAADRQVGRDRAQYAPTLDFVASYGGNYASGSLTTPQDFSTQARSTVIGITLNVPIFSGGQTSARVAEALAHRDKAEANLETARRQARTDARDAFSAEVDGLSQIEALNEAVRSGKAAVRGNRVGYALGIRINLDVLDAQDELYRSAMDLTKTRYDTLYQGLKLKAAAGVLSGNDVATVNSLLVSPPVSVGAPRASTSERRASRAPAGPLPQPGHRLHTAFQRRGAQAAPLIHQGRVRQCGDRGAAGVHGIGCSTGSVHRHSLGQAGLLGPGATAARVKRTHA